MNEEELNSVETTETPVAEPPVEPASMEMPETTEETPIESAPMETPAPVEAPTSAPDAPAAENTNMDADVTAPTNDLTAATITPPSLETPEDPTVKKKSKAPLIIIIAIVAIVVICAIVLGITQFGSTSKRIEKLTDKLFEQAIQTVNKQKQTLKDQESGAYNISLSAEVGADGISGLGGNVAINGKYGYDFPNKDVYATVKIEDLVVLKQSLLGKNAIEAGAEIDKDTAYITLKDFLDKTVKITDPTFKELLEEIEKALKSNDGMDLAVVLTALKNATNDALKAMESKQGMKSGSVGLHNAITINITNANMKLATKAFFTSLANNKGFIEQIKKVDSELTDEMIKKSLEDAAEWEDDADLDKSETTVEIATALFGEKLLGIFITSKNTNELACDKNAITSIDIVTNDNGVTITIVDPETATVKIEVKNSTKDGAQVEDIKITATIKEVNKKYNDDFTQVTSCTNASTSTITGNITTTLVDKANEKSVKLAVNVDYEEKDEESKETSAKVNGKFEINLGRTIDASYNKSSTDKTNAIDYTELTEQDLYTLMSKVQEVFGPMADILNQFIGVPSEPTNTDDYDFDFDF